MSFRHLAFAAFAASLLTTAAHAAQLVVTSYDMPNGDGTAHGGVFNYWDGGYTGSGAVTTDGLSGSTLSGGTGVLTDGVIASNSWDLSSNAAGTGLYVGWLQSPTIVFHFGSAVTIKEIKLYVDNAHTGGVTAPDDILVNGLSVASPPWTTASAPLTIDITGLDITGDSVSVQLHDPTYWVFLSEAQFFSETEARVPEPASWALMLLGFGGLGGALRQARRRRRGSQAA